jgi:hypothetical protein
MADAVVLAPEETEDEFQIDWSPRRALGWLAAIYVSACVLRLLFNRAVPAPYIFNDESRYLDLARSAVGPRGLYWNHVPIDFPCWIYPLLIAPAAKLWPFARALFGIQLINTLLINLAIPLTYAWGREVISRRRAVLAAGLVALLPAMGYSATVMTENAFMPAMVLALWLVWRQLLKPHWQTGLLAGLAAALTLHVKPHGMLLPPVMFAAACVVEACRALRMPAANIHERHGRFILALWRHGSMALGYVLGLLPRLAAIHWIEHPGEPFQLRFFMGMYHGVGITPEPFRWGHFGENLWLQIATWVAACGVLPAWWLLAEIARTLGGRHRPPRMILILLTTFFTGGMLLLVARHMVLWREHWIMYERYLFVVYPPLLILFASRVPLRVRRAWFPLVNIAALLPVLGFAWLLRANWTVPTNTPALSAALLLNANFAQWGLYGVLVILLLIASLALFILPLARTRHRLTALVVLLLAMNLGWYGTMQQLLEDASRAQRHLVAKVSNKVGPTDTLYVLTDGFDFTAFFRMAAWHDTRLIAWHDDGMQWLTHILPIPASGQFSMPAAPGGIYLLTHQSISLEGRKGDSIENARLYKVSADQLLTLTMRPQGATTAPVAIAEKLPVYPLKIEKLDLPVFHAGKLASLRFVLHNISRQPFPSGKQPLSVGYHWSDPPRTGKWESVVWDDGRAVRVPTLEPGTTATLTLEIMVPHPPSRTWLLGLAPYITQSKRHLWGEILQPPTPVNVVP